MKNKSMYRIMAFLVMATIFIAACTKESSDVRLDPKLATTQVTSITSSAATVAGFVIASGDGFSEKGICYGIAPAPTTSQSKVLYTGADTKATFKVTLSGLDYATKYYARAYGISADGTIYGEEVNFTTLPVVPTLTTAEITSITGISAVGGGEVTISGGADVTARGVCYGTSPNPTVAGSKTTDGDSLGVFTSNLTGLNGFTTYYARAYATNSAGTGYGPEVIFKTLVGLPTVTTTAVTEITKISAVSGGNVTNGGGATITARGLAWGLSANPTTDDDIIDGGTGTGEFVSDLTGLTLYTTYHVRAYATNSAGTAYGNDVSFTTLADITKFWVVGGYNGWDNSDAAKYIISTATSGGDAEGYVYLTAGGFKLTTDHSWTDPYTFGDDGTGTGLLKNPGSDITVSSTGYYLIKANQADMTYSLTKTDWGVIGDASPGGWGDETALVYDATSATWRGVMHLTAAKIKFRANHTWDYNYGSTAGDATLNAGGSDIPIALESDYSIVLDLSHPNEYTYSANRWGVIGSATADGWNSDQNMTWDVANSVFTATVDLIVGKIKFRANDDWAVNYGGALDALTPGGADIDVAVAGNYTITFDPWGLVATVTLNSKK
jgi:starch-binding outer membrane protein SusE/F